jgi:hypothetical protein
MLLKNVCVIADNEKAEVSKVAQSADLGMFERSGRSRGVKKVTLKERK